MNIAKLGKSVWAAFLAVCVDVLIALIIEAIWQTIVLSLGLTEGYYNTINYASDAAVLIVGGFILTASIGLPVQAIIQHFGFVAWSWYSFPAACVIAAIACLFTTLTHYQRHPILVWIICFGLGFIGGTVFWLIRRPDKDLSAKAPA